VAAELIREPRISGNFAGHAWHPLPGGGRCACLRRVKSAALDVDAHKDGLKIARAA